ncbi:glycosyltransferase family 4 protein [Shinella zoogloeoides]|uniref:glycosyltransferase family 4 protein n=1 Tax=Shinella zoogloeoides TaxID=352475 RepID=UPI000E65A856|nr:glycosyltransferase family 4 protein [Shinella zoogloeoides]WPE19636.1 D-inositol-3-phosphate glycosyltransferase [Shinella zoogloeoides]
MADDGPLRIIHCFRSPVGGIFRHVRDLAEYHTRAGHEVGIICDSLTGGSFEDKLFDEIRPHLSLGLVRMPISRSVNLRDLGAIRDSYREIKGLQPDVLHGHGAKGGAIARLIGSILRVNRYRVARLYTPHGGSLHYTRRSATGLAVLTAERLLEPFGDAIAFVCDYEKDAYTARVGRPRIQTARIYNGIHDRDFERVYPREDAVDFLYIGMLRDLKGPDVFVDAFARAERIAGRPLSALMIGDGPDREKYKQMMLQLGLGRRIVMMPAMKAREAFALTRNVVVPSRAEAMPYIVLEALAAQKPVIASRVGGIPEVLGRDSIALTEPGDAQSLAAAMAQAIGDPGWLRKVMPEPAAFKETFSASAMSGSILALYRDILARQAGGRRLAETSAEALP